ncbi:MAG: UDPglucose--hexose-phosphate uridylyltransferase [Solirubrobacteraceae bacterium]|nr:UDPglucose--hexose-phosphate uridylyltransferase [Solirubrobacteraceae bacterium]
MREVRVDPLSGQRAIVATERAERPGGEFHVEPAARLDPSTDPFSEGHEDLTPPELYAVRPGGGPPNSPGWAVRVVPNLYPALTPDAPEPPPQPNPDLFWAGPARGAHEVIINAPDPVTSLAHLTVEQCFMAMEVWRERMRAHSEAACRHLIVNERTEAGASLPHTHAQLYALEFVPSMIARERERFGAYATRTMGGNLLADLVQEEVRRRERIVAIDEESVLMAPFGSRFPFQLMIAPRTPRMRFEDDGPIAAAMLHDALGRLARRFGVTPPLNLWIRTAPSGAEHFGWRIDIVPRLTHIAGLELGAGLNLNVAAPERAASELRES